jgi:hypothetical protein
MLTIDSIRSYLDNRRRHGAIYEKWFGTYDAPRFGVVRAVYMNMSRIVHTFNCVTGPQAECNGRPAYVNPNQFSNVLDFLHIYADNSPQTRT